VLQLLQLLHDELRAEVSSSQTAGRGTSIESHRWPWEDDEMERKK
jgi:hypothetical protein